MIKVKNIYNGNEVYFRFYASMKFPGCFWHTKTEESSGFELARLNDYEPLDKTWKEIYEEK